jgi:2-oxo-3-hexenedioate decarboxylase
MMIDPKLASELADALAAAQQQVRPIPKLTQTHPGLTVDDGYVIQDALLTKWRQAGRRLVGIKAGLTSYAKMEQMGISSAAFGVLMDDMACEDGSLVNRDVLIHPKLEVEIAFITNRVIGDRLLSIDEVLEAIGAVRCSFEIIDSRYEGFQFDAPSVIADNTSSALYVLGDESTTIGALDLADIPISLERNGSMIAEVASSAVLGNPAKAVEMLAKWAHDQGRLIDAGSLILTGSVTQAYTIERGDRFTARFEGIGEVSTQFS